MVTIFIISFSLNLLKVFDIPGNAVPLDNPIYFYIPCVLGKGFDFSVEKVDVFKENKSLFSINTEGETGFYFSDDLKYIIGVKNNILNLYINRKFFKSYRINSFYGGHFSKGRFVARAEDGVYVIDKNDKKFYKGLIDLYYLENGILKICADKIWLERKDGEKILPSPDYIRKISVSDNFIVYSTKNEIYFYNIQKDLLKKIKIKGSITSISAGENFVFTGILYGEKGFIKVFDLEGNEIYENVLGACFISKIYKYGNKVYVLNNKKIIEFEIK